MTEAQRNAALATYQRAVQTAFREVADALARRATMDEQLAATQRQQAAAADVFLLEKRATAPASTPTSTCSTRSDPIMRCSRRWSRTRLTAAQNRVTLYQALGGDSLLQTAPLCGVSYVNSANSAKLASQCSPI